MSYKSKYLVVLVLLYSVNSFSQIESWYKSDLGRLGYKHNQLVFKDADVPPELKQDISPDFKVSGGSFDLAVDMYFKHTYFHIDGSVIPDFLVASFPGQGDKERWFDNSDYFVERGQIFPVRLAFGLPLGKYFGLYAGGQWQHLTTDVRFNSVPERGELIKGNQRGYGVHSVFAYRKLIMKYSFMQDWIRAARTWPGKARTHEITVMYGFKSVGAFLNINHMWRQKNGGLLPANYRSATFRNDVQTNNLVEHATKQMTQFTVSFGIYASGLFSGVTGGISNAAVKIEQGNAAERRWKRRNTIEYKD